MPRVAPPPKQPSWKRRSRNYLTPNEVDSLIQAAKQTKRHGHRNATMILMAFRHALRASELVSLKWDQVNLKEGFLAVHRLKNGVPATHPLWGPELRALRKLQRDYPNSPYLFTTDRGAPITRRTYQHIVTVAAEGAGIGFPVSSHALRHALGYKLVNDGHDIRSIGAYMGHRNLNNTAIYTQLNARAFKGFWKD
jgi:site-specific recombinase XerD